MSKIEELIKKLCPNGVEYKTIGELFDVKNGYTPSKNNKYFWENGNIPWFRMDDIRTNGNILNDATQHITELAIKNRKFPKDSLIVATTATIGVHALIKCDFVCNQQLTCVAIKEKLKNDLNIKFCFYYFDIIDEQCKKIANQGGGMPIVSLEKMKKLVFPVPPLEVQCEIVHILDDFTLLSAELSAELKARQKQYQFYLNNLLDIEKLKPQKIMYVKDLFEIKNGLNKEKGAFGKGTPIVNFTDVYKNRYLTKNMLKGKVTLNEGEIKRYAVEKGDVFFTRTSETKEDIGMSSTVIEDIEKCTFSGFVLRARPTTDLLIPKFCAYYFSTNKVRDTIIRYASFTTRATTSGPKLAKIPVPIISIKEQEKIVNILDRFDKLCNDISEGLPAEIEARQKQYEYYRDKLLTFKELKVNE